MTAREIIIELLVHMRYSRGDAILRTDLMVRAMK